MRKVHQYSVHPAIPPRLAGLTELAYNLRWTWDDETELLFVRLEPDMWSWSGHNPVLMLNQVPQERLNEAAEDEAFLAHLDRVTQSLRSYMTDPGWFPRQYPDMAGLRIAYFSMEFGIADCLPIYSGGLGVLAGDHLKSASGRDMPVVGVGLLYKQGYFTQYLNADGWQLERNTLLDFDNLPVTQVVGSDGSPLRVTVPMGDREVVVAVWLAQVGRIPLYLLDTYLPQNDPTDQTITGELYGGGPETRIRQEMVLGIGGLRALRELGIEPQVCHMNEGHSAMLALERVRTLMEQEGIDYQAARQIAGAGTLFTTHTPVPAGFDLFPRELMERYFSAYVEKLGMDWETFLGLGRMNPDDPNEQFNMTVLAVRHSPRRNAVSRLHRRVSARMFESAWPDFPESEIPIESITNGVHVLGWVAPEMAGLLDRYLGPSWAENPGDPEVWRRISRIPDEELWRVRERLRGSLVAQARAQLQQQMAHQPRLASRERRIAGEALRTDALTIGFARRFATYKRAVLILSDPERLKALLLDEERPVQLVFAGKAHPQDDAGKDFIRQIVHFARNEGVEHRMVFLEDYDLYRAAFLVRGVDVWLNTPRRPMEASGTSGMKVLVNGGLNLSVLDGWWVEGYRPGAGWAIGTGEEFTDYEYQDRVESQALYSLLENEVVPLFYHRGPDGVPREWIAMMKESMGHLVPIFSTSRMVKEYFERFYLPAAEHYARLRADRGRRATAVAEWKRKVTEAWQDVMVVSVEDGDHGALQVGEKLPVKVRVQLGRLSPQDVRVEAFRGFIRPDGTIGDGEGVQLSWTGEEDGIQLYEGQIPTLASGRHGYSVRVLPYHEDVLVPNEIGFVTWE